MKKRSTTFNNTRYLASGWCKGVVSTFILCIGALSHAAETELLDLEKEELKFGFIKLTDMAPLAVAYENGYFEKASG